MARLIITSSSDPSGAPAKTVEVASEVLSIGRDASNQIPLPGESKASRKHCQIVPLKDGYEVVDLESTNGTRVNGDAVKRRTLRHGDVVEVGLTKIRFEDEKSAARDAGTKEACFLEHTAGDRKGERVYLTTARTTLGRRETNTIVLTDRMASGHHAEIVKDLNGYTLRDLGSTNGTLVNGELTTEALLTHGTRVRIGNARFVFKDPAMAHIEVELAGLKDDEEDGGWGMMADLDVAKAKGGAGSVVAAVLLLVAVGGFAYWQANREATEAQGTGVDVENRVGDADFEATESVPWAADEASAAVTAKQVAKGRPGGGAALSVHNGGDTPAAAVARYAEDIEVSRSVAYEVGAWIERQGDAHGELAVQWIGYANAKAGATALVQTVRVGSPKSAGSWEHVKAELTPPGWADAARPAVLVGGGATVLLDDVRFAPGRPTGDASSLVRAAGSTDVRVSAAGAVDLQRSATVLLVGATPWARMPGGRTLGGAAALRVRALPTVTADGIEVQGDLADEQGSVPATIAWKKADDGLTLHVKVDGAEAVGVSMDFVRAHLEDGIRALGGFAPARLSAHAGEALDAVRKVLAGDPKPPAANARPPTLVAFEAPAGASDAGLRLADADDAGLVRMTLSRPGAETTIGVITDFSRERQEAQAKLQKAMAMLSGSPGEAIPALRAVAQEYPFLDDIRDQASKGAQARETKAGDDVKKALETLRVFRIEGSAERLLDAETQALALGSQFPASSGAKDNLSLDVQTYVKDVKDARLRFDLEIAAPEVRRLSRLAQMLETEAGYAAIAAVYYTAIVERYGSLEESAGGDEVGKKVKEARDRAAELFKDPKVRAAVPNWPHK